MELPVENRLRPRQQPGESPVMFQRWSDLLFLHWEVPADLLRQGLPAGLHLDTFEGKAFLGIVPFFMERIRPRWLPPVPGLSWFLELNLRTYVHDERGQPGVWFYSLDCNQPIAVELARALFHLPYQHARMKACRKEDLVEFSSSRVDSSSGQEEAAVFHYRPVSPREVAEPGSLEFFLLERYLLFSTTRDERLKIGQVHHQPYPFQAASCEKFSTLPFRYNGFPEPAETPCSILYSPGVDVGIYPLRGV